MTTAVAKMSDPAAYNVAGIIPLACGEAIDLTYHCVDRWWERVQVAAPNFERAMLSLTWIATAVGHFAPKAKWIWTADPRARYLYLTEEIALIVVNQAAVTCVVKCSPRRPPKASRESEQFSTRTARLLRLRMMQRSITEDDFAVSLP